MKVTVTIDTLIEVAHGRLTPKQLASVLLFRGVWLFGRYRGSIFILNEREHSEPLGRNERARALFLAEQYEKRTKQPGQRGTWPRIAGSAASSRLQVPEPHYRAP